MQKNRARAGVEQEVVCKFSFKRKKGQSTQWLPPESRPESTEAIYVHNTFFLKTKLNAFQHDVFVKSLSSLFFYK